MVSYLSRKKLFSFCFNIQSFLANNCFSYLFTVFAIIVKNTGLSNFEINYKADVRAYARDSLAREFSNFL